MEFINCVDVESRNEIQENECKNPKLAEVKQLLTL